MLQRRIENLKTETWPGSFREGFPEEMIGNGPSPASLMPGSPPTVCTGLCKTHINRVGEFPLSHNIVIGYFKFSCFPIHLQPLLEHCSPLPHLKNAHTSTYKIVSAIKPFLEWVRAGEAPSPSPSSTLTVRIPEQCLCTVYTFAHSLIFCPFIHLFVS